MSSTLRDGHAVVLGVLVAALGVGAAGCSSSSGSDGGTSGGTTGGTTGGTFTVTISSFRFSPDPLVVPAGATITFKNTDSTAHTATSEAASGNFTPGEVSGGFTFDTMNIGSGAMATVTVPANIASGTVQPYYCNNHRAGMANPNPTIHVQ
jgi:plastocyanin